MNSLVVISLKSLKYQEFSSLLNRGYYLLVIFNRVIFSINLVPKYHTFISGYQLIIYRHKFTHNNGQCGGCVIKIIYYIYVNFSV